MLPGKILNVGRQSEILKEALMPLFGTNLKLKGQNTLAISVTTLTT